MAVDTGRSTDRKKDLQNATLWSVRSMRAVFCDAYRKASHPYRDLLTDRGPSKAALNTFVAEDHFLGGRRVQRVAASL